ncbi:polyprenyl synthetase family protein [Litoreibacter roseus]|uniref:Geranylgeranyl diphosphate synthase n=1 Tax=Litoreibacter roseus TaxID=2601869 RepID=A0A6N6JHM8_9RHOB|nr:farnesyl diphosphate synthase [Litoreibacter roseus]GFE64722.1 farnesyl-diphosphate synthase [Litoreibacter roseus]
MFQAALEDAQDRIETALQSELSGIETTIGDAMRYTCQGGKRLRGFLALESARLHDVSQGTAMSAACAIEMVHAYSLVHDDLPCMDDDDLRRGRPTVHKKWDEATAVLTGDALLTYAFEVLLKADVNPSRQIDLLQALAKAAGPQGMVLGQALDIAAEAAKTPLGIDEITHLQRGKTGALISWSAMAGPRMAGDDTSALEGYADRLGLAFQICDDILDVEGNPEDMGKRLQKDGAANKATFVSLLGLDGAKSRARDLMQDAIDALESYGTEARNLKDAARFVIDRKT